MNRKLKLVHVQVLPILSGVQKITLNLFRNLDKTRYDLYLICGETENGMEPALITESEALGVKVIQLQELKRKLGIS